MSNSDLMTMFFSMLLGQLPILIIGVVAIILILSKRKLVSEGAIWGLLGFGIILFLSVSMPLLNTAVQNWVLQSDSVDQRVWVYSVLGIVFTILHALAYAFLLVAILIGRSQSATPPPVHA